MKTPMQELIDDIDVLIEETSTNHYKFIKNLIVKNYIQREKQVIIDTFNEAHQAGRFEEKGIAETGWVTAEKYYKETFK